jgi:hypothetical protein
MPSFDTPEAVSVTARVEAGSIQFSAGDRLDTVVEVQPRNPQREPDVRTADQTEVTYVGGVLTVWTPKANLFGLGPVVWIRSQTRVLARASAALSSVADAPRRLPPPPCSYTRQAPLTGVERDCRFPAT